MLFLRGFAGWLLDLLRISRFTFRNPHSYTKYKAIRALARRTGARNFIETGTYRGTTTLRCARHFDKVYTIELDERLAEAATKRLAKYSNVRVIRGDAVQELRRLLEDRSLSDLLVFLDGHFSGGETALGDVPEPALEALDLLAEHRDRVRGIIVDDFREFGQSGWPRKSSLIAAAEDAFAAHGYQIAVHLDQVVVEAPPAARGDRA